MQNERRDRLVSAANSYLQKYRAGQIEKFPTMAKLGQETGYKDNGQVGKILRTEGIYELRRTAELEKLAVPYAPSEELAWVMGYFSEHGTNTSGDLIGVQDKTPETRSKYIRLAENTFGQKPVPARTGKDPDSVFLYSKSISSRVGDISRNAYFHTLMERYGWIAKDTKFTRSFLEGLIDAKGHIEKRRAVIHTINGDFAEYVSSLLQKVGVTGVATYFIPSNNYWAINLSSEEGLKTLANNIHLQTPEKEAVLNEKRSHAHRWIIDEPTGATSMGKCAGCSKERIFNNFLPDDYAWKEPINKRIY